MTDEHPSRGGGRSPDLYEGDETKWPEWSILVRSFLRRHRDDVPHLLRVVETQPDPLATTDMDDEVRVLAGKIMSDLTSFCRGSALRLIAQLDGGPEADNGFEA